jgi:hypothetical protein
VEAERALGELTNQAGDSLGKLLLSIWSGGEALISVISLALVGPIIACYLIYDWNRMIASIDQRETVQALASKIDDKIRGFVQGQSLLCLVLAAFYASALWLIGLNHAALIGISAGLLSFIPYLGALSGLVISMCAAIAQFSPDWTATLLVFAIFFVGNRLRTMSRAVSGRPTCAFESRVDPVCAICLRLSVWLHWLLMAEPVAAAIGVLMRFALRQYYASPLHGGAATAAPSRKIG